MIHHPFLLLLGVLSFVAFSLLEILYYRRGFPRLWSWRISLVAVSTMSVLFLLFALLSSPMEVFQSGFAIFGLLFCIVMSGVVALFTVPRAMREADRNKRNQ